MKIGLFLMTYKGLRVLQSIVDRGYVGNVGFVCIGKDAQIANDHSAEIEAIAVANQIPRVEKTDVKNYVSQVDYSIAISWRWMIEAENLIVLHDSLLPKYRGFAPLVNMLKNGETRIGVTAIFAADQYDKGDVVAQSASDISYPIKINAAIEAVTANYVEVVNFIFETITHNRPLLATTQDEAEATYSLWLDERDYRIDWSKDSSYISRFVDAVGFPYQGAFAFLNGDKIKVHQAEAVADVKIENRDVGKIIYFDEGCPVVVCGSGLIKIVDAVYDKELGESILPLKKFRSRFE